MLEAKRRERTKQEARERIRQAALRVRVAGALGVDLRRNTDDEQRETAHQPSRGGVVKGDGTFQGKCFTFVQAQNTPGIVFEYFIFALIIANVGAFMAGTVSTLEPLTRERTGALWFFELASVAVFSLEYLLRFYAAGQNPKHAGVVGRLRFIVTFYSIVDLVSILPFFIAFAIPGDQRGSTFLRALRLLRMFKGESYTKAFTVFDDVIRANSEVTEGPAHATDCLPASACDCP